MPREGETPLSTGMDDWCYFDYGLPAQHYDYAAAVLGRCMPWRLWRKPSVLTSSEWAQVRARKPSSSIRALAMIASSVRSLAPLRPGPYQPCFVGEDLGRVLYGRGCMSRPVMAAPRDHRALRLCS